MINTLKVSFKIDFNYAINSFIYRIKKTPILKNIITANLYNKEGFKTFVRILAIICTSLKVIFFRYIYFFIILYIARLISKDVASAFLHIYFVFCLIGIFINTFIMTTSRKRYISIMLFNMNAKKFILSHYLLNSCSNLILNTLFLIFIGQKLHIPLYLCIIISLFSLFSKNIGEALSVGYYRKNKVRLLTDKLYYLIIIVGLLISLLPFLNIYFDYKFIIVMTIICFVITIPSFIYLFSVNDYKLIYKKINSLNSLYNTDTTEQNYRQLLVNINEKDIEISPNKLKGKSGYDLFNTIFFERHRYILLRSAKIYAIIISLLIGITIFVVIKFPNYQSIIKSFLTNHLGLLVFVMYFINRGAIVTQAMFLNCDHSMLSFNFYKEPEAILELFKKRLITLIKVNLVPAIPIALGLPIILLLIGKLDYSYIGIILFPICLSVFFSIHYLVIYYLLQPYSKDMKMKSPMYSMVSFLTYVVCYFCAKLNFNATIFCVLCIIFTILYTVISLRLVFKKAPYTFKIK